MYSLDRRYTPPAAARDGRNAELHGPAIGESSGEDPLADLPCWSRGVLAGYG
jgi:hypothetical protein